LLITPFQLLYAAGNLLISNRGEVKVADLGVMKQLERTTGLKNLPTAKEFVRTSTYMSPERIDGKEYSFPSDIWALGLTLHAVAVGKLAVNTTGGFWSILQSIRDDAPPRLPPDIFSKELCDFIACCLQKEPEKRWTTKQLMRHPFLNAVVPEDTDEDMLDRQYAVSEMEGIISAIFTHIKHVKRQWEDTSADGTATHSHRIYGDLSLPAEEILYVVVFGKKKTGNDLVMINVPALSTSCASPAGKKAAKMQLLRPKLVRFARQLRIPLSVLQAEARR
jgi:serine/threonine protein kinase